MTAVIELNEASLLMPERTFGMLTAETETARRTSTPSSKPRFNRNVLARTKRRPSRGALAANATNPNPSMTPAASGETFIAPKQSQCRNPI